MPVSVAVFAAGLVFFLVGIIAKLTVVALLGLAAALWGMCAIYLFSQKRQK